MKADAGPDPLVLWEISLYNLIAAALYVHKHDAASYCHYFTVVSCLQRPMQNTL